MRATHTNTVIENTLNHDGYVIVDFLKSDELVEVNNRVRELGYGKIHDEKFRTSIYKDPVEKLNQIFDTLSPVFQTAAKRFLQDYKLLRIVIFDKGPGGGKVSVHQHPTLVDESRYRSFAIWIPLADTTVDMGTLHVIKGSHIISNHIRSFGENQKICYDVSQRIITRYSTPLLLKAGQAVILDDRLIHWSPPNKSPWIRTAIQLELIPLDAKLAIHYRASDTELLKYEISEECYKVAQLSRVKPDNLKFITKVKQKHFFYNNKQFISKIINTNPNHIKLKGNIFRRLFNL